MHQLGSARGRALGKVHGLQQHNLEATRRRVNRHSQTGGTTTNDGQVIHLGLSQTMEQLCAGCGLG